ncbi:MAG: rhomboid family intramembrane serine protease [Bacteroidota bacterium]
MPIYLFLLVITCLVSYQAFNNPTLLNKLKHSPYLELRNKEYYRFITSGFVHGGWLHLGINMFVLWEFGKMIEMMYVAHFGEIMGRINFVLLYLLTIIFADIPTFLKHKNNPHYASVGASGAISGIVFVYILFFPWQKIYLYGIVGIHSIFAGLAYLAYSSWASKNSRDNIDHEAHFYGAVFGFLFTIVLKPSLLQDFLSNLVNNFPF